MAKILVASISNRLIQVPLLLSKREAGLRQSWNPESWFWDSRDPESWFWDSRDPDPWFWNSWKRDSWLRDPESWFRDSYSAKKWFWIFLDIIASERRHEKEVITTFSSVWAIYGVTS